MKKILVRFVFICLILINLSVLVQANETWDANSGPYSLNLMEGEEKAESIIQLDAEHYVTVILTEERFHSPMCNTVRRKLTADYTVKNITGRVMGSLTVKGTFDTNGSTSTPVEIYGYGSVVGYDVQNIDNSLGSPGSNSWASSTLVCVPLDYLANFARTCTITCDANGNNSASWN